MRACSRELRTTPEKADTAADLEEGGVATEETRAGVTKDGTPSLSEPWESCFRVLEAGELD